MQRANRSTIHFILFSFLVAMLLFAALLKNSVAQSPPMPSPTPQGKWPPPTVTPSSKTTSAPPSLTTQVSASSLGNLIAYNLPDSNVWTINTDGTNAHSLNTGDSCCVAWSSDGTKIAYRGISGDSGTHDIYVMNSDGSNKVRLTTQAGWDWSPTWSPDDQQIAFSTNRDGQVEIYVMNADGSGQINISNHPAGDWDPVWSPSGTRLLFTSDRDGDFEIYSMKPDGSDVQQLTFNSALDWRSGWSSDSQKIIFASDQDGDFEIYMMNADGSGVSQLTHNTYNDESPDFSPNGQKIVFNSDRTGSKELFTMNLDGTNQIQLTVLGGQIPRWQPNASTLNGARECLQVPFTVPGGIGVETNQQYSGVVNVSVSGGGQSAGIAYNDAFWLYLDQFNNRIEEYVEPFHLYIDHEPAINMLGGTPPPYQPNHVYTFVIDVGPVPRTINFAIGDLFTVDNEGSFTICLSDSQSFTITDSDNDGIWDHWESEGGGIDADNDGNIDLDLYAMGARPDRKDIFLEIDWLDEGNGHTHIPTQEAINIVKDAFAAHDIELHVEFSTAIPTSASITKYVNFCGSLPGAPCDPGVSNFDAIKADYIGNAGDSQATKDARAFVYHYVLFAHQLCPSCNASKASGLGELLGNDFIVTLRCANNSPAFCWWQHNWRVSRVHAEAGTLMHELGHNLGLKHGGGQHFNWKPNYLSVMNYHFQFGGIPTASGEPRYDYSNEQLPSLNEISLDESAGIGKASAQTYYTCDLSFNLNSTNIQGPVAGKPIDWNCSSDEPTISANINNVVEYILSAPVKVRYDDSKPEIANVEPDNQPPFGDGLVRLDGYDDWANLELNFRNDWDWLEGYHLSLPPEPELDSETVQLLIPARIYLPIIVK